jgi:hypothetical protein
MSQVEIIDTIPAFLHFWAEIRDEPLTAQIEAWASQYMARWPELLAKQVEDYEGQGEDWRAVAQERVFPSLGDKIAAMQTAHSNLKELCGPLYDRAEHTLGFQSDAVFVIYVGVGCGAGWVTKYQDTPAILLGLENLVECGWGEPPALAGLIAHEVGHLAHFHWRAQHGKAEEGSGPWWQIYEEGFAQRCEHLVMGEDTWHMRIGAAGDWLAWCQAHQRWLASEYLRVADGDGSLRPFFGSWYDIEGYSQTGYYLGHAVIRLLEQELSLRQIALLDAEDGRLRGCLARIAAGDA